MAEQTAGTDLHTRIREALHCYRADVHEGHEYGSEDHGEFWCPGQGDEDEP